MLVVLYHLLTGNFDDAYLAAWQDQKISMTGRTRTNDLTVNTKAVDAVLCYQFCYHLLVLRNDKGILGVNVRKVHGRVA